VTGRLQATGELAVTRVDRNVDATPSEAYAGAVYSPPMVHRVSRGGHFRFRRPGRCWERAERSSMWASGSTGVVRVDFPQLIKTVVNTYWPTVVQDENCQHPDANEASSGAQCTGTYLSAAGLPEAPYEGGGKGRWCPAEFQGHDLTRTPIIDRDVKCHSRQALSKRPLKCSHASHSPIEHIFRNRSPRRLRRAEGGQIENRAKRKGWLNTRAGVTQQRSRTQTPEKHIQVAHESERLKLIFLDAITHEMGICLTHQAPTDCDFGFVPG